MTHRGIVRQIIFLLIFCLSVIAVKASDQSTTVKGWVLDSACAFTHNLKKPISSECAVSCAKAGSPLVILTDAGTIYWPISSEMPAKGQNVRLMEFAGKRVAVTGKTYLKGGAHGIVIEKIEASEAKH